MINRSGLLGAISPNMDDFGVARSDSARTLRFLVDTMSIHGLLLSNKNLSVKTASSLQLAKSILPAGFSAGFVVRT
jgi:hypothetical protein